ncbi:PREDICTED: uncharacterized protein LOC106815623 [Priapulus caudatus]|uniref:Uncharacterized protein LOC106815623 n=1 Tax=Priapulus caudatus TaxID=37621 RepID=A0ABM1ETS7_PRICU|nr:PREDICTED: uncharacterized protein LOC106815623 [Priapulus caudatus]
MRECDDVGEPSSDEILARLTGFATPQKRFSEAHRPVDVEDLLTSLARIKMQLELTDSVEDIPFLSQLLCHADFLAALNLHNQLVGALASHRCCVPVSTEAEQLLDEVSSNSH